MSYDRVRICIETVENGFVVELPDWEAIAEKEKAAKKNNKSGMDTPCYIGDCTEKYTAKDIPAVIKLVKGALEQMPEADYDKAFNEAAGGAGK